MAAWATTRSAETRNTITPTPTSAMICSTRDTMVDPCLGGAGDDTGQYDEHLDRITDMEHELN